MKYIAIILAIVSFGLSQSVFADVYLKLGEGVTVLAKNGKYVSSNSLFKGQGILRLENGQTQVLVQYTAEIKTSSDDYELESSDVFVILFVASDKKLTLTAPEVVSVIALENFNRSGSWSLLDQGGVSQKINVAPLKKSGLQLSRDYERELSEFNMSSSLAAMKPAVLSGTGFDDVKPGVPVEMMKIEAHGAAAKTLSNLPEKMLEYWYNQADAITREEFKVWVDQ